MARKNAKLALAVVLAIAIAGILVAYAAPRVRSFANKRVEAAVGSLQETVYSITGLRLGYGYAVLSSSSRVAIREIELFQETADEYAVSRRKVLSIADLDLRIDFWAAIFGKPQDIINEIAIKGLALDLVLPADQAIYERISSYLAGQPAGELPHLTLDIADAAITVHEAGNGRYSSSISSLQISTISGSVEVVASTALLFASLPAFGSDELFLQATTAKAAMSPNFATMSATAGISGSLGGVSIAEQVVSLSKIGEWVELRLGSGKGLEGVVRYGFKEGVVGGEVSLAGYRPEGDISGLSGVGKELLGLSYEGRVGFSVAKGVVGYEGSVKATGGRGQSVGGVSVEGATVEVTGKGDGTGIGELKVRGLVNGYDLGYEGSLGYEGLKVFGVVSVGTGNDVVKGEVKGEKGTYEVSVGEGMVRGIGIKSVLAKLTAKGRGYGLALDGAFVVGGETVSVKGSGEYGKGITFAGDIGYRGMSYGVEGNYAEGVVKVKGGYGLEGMVEVGTGGTYKGSLKATGLPISVGTGVVYGDLSLTGGYGADKVWWVDGESIGVRYEGEGEYPSLGMKGVKVSEGKVEVGELTVRGKGYGLKGNLKASYGAKGVEGSGVFIGEGSLGEGTASYEISVGYGSGRGKVKVGVKGYDLGLAGLKGYRGNAVLEGSGELSLDEVLKGEYGKLDGWVLKGKAGVGGDSLTVSEQDVEVWKAGDTLFVKVGSGKGLEGVVRYGFKEGVVGGEVSLAGYRPEGDISGLSGVGKELLGLSYEGRVGFSVAKGVVGYEGSVKATGGRGQSVGGVSVEGATVEVTGKGDGTGIGELKVRGLVNGYDLGYEGSLGYEGLKVFGVVSVGTGNDVVKGEVKGEKGTYEVSVGEGMVRGIGIKSVLAKLTAKGRGYGLALDGTFVVGGETVSVKGSGEYGKGITFAGDIGYRGMSYGVEGNYAEGVVKVKGGYGLEGMVEVGTGGTYKGSLKAMGLPISVGTGVVYGDLSLTGGYGADKVWWVDGESIGVRYEGEGEYPSLGMKGVKVSEGKVEVGELTVRGKGYGLKGNLKASYGAKGVEGSGVFIGEGSLGEGTASYEISVGYGSGRGKVKVGVKGYDLGLAGLKGYRGNAVLEGSGELSLDEVLKGEYGKLDGWVLKGKAGVGGDSLTVSEQDVEVWKAGDTLFVKVGSGKGLEGVVRYGFKEGVVGGEVSLAGYRPEGDISGLSGVGKELLGLSYEGRVGFSVAKGVVGYEGSVKATGGRGQSVGGVSVEGATVEVTGKGDGTGIGELKVRGLVNGYDLGYEGSLGYEGLKVFGVVSVGTGNDVVKGEVKGEKGTYEVSVGEGMVRGIGIKGLTAGVAEKDERYDIKVSGEIGGGTFTTEGSILKGKKGYEWNVDLSGMEVMGLLTAAEGFGMQVPSLGITRALVSGNGTVRGDYEKVSWAVGNVEGELSTGSGTVKVKGSGVGDGSRYEIKGLEVVVGGETVSVKGSGEYGKGITFAGDIGYRGMSYGVEGNYAEGVVRVKGGYGLEGMVEVGTGGTYKGSLKAMGLPISVGTGVVYGDLSLTGGYGADKVWWVDGESIGVRYEGEGEYPSLGMKGVKVSEGKVEVGELTVRGKGYGLKGNLKASYGAKGVEGSGVFIGEGSLGEGTASYEISVGYGSGRGKVKVGVKGYDLGLAGLKGYRGNAVLEGSGELSLDEVLKGEYGKLDGWVLKGKAGVGGDSLTVSEQDVEVWKAGDTLFVKVGSGKGLEGVVRYGFKEGVVGGEVSLAGYRPEGDISGLSGVGKELLGLSYEGRVGFSVAKGVVGYEGSVKATGGRGQSVGGVSVEGATVEVTGKGDGTGIGELKVRGLVNGYDLGYEGSLGYEGLKVFGVVSVGTGERCGEGGGEGREGDL